MLRTISVFILALISGTIIVSIAHTHVVLSALTAAGAEIPAGIRVDAIMRDLQGFAPTLLILNLIGFLIAFPVAGLIARLLGEGWRRLGFALAGMAAIIVMMLAITSFYAISLDATITPVAAAREPIGLLTLSIGGAAAGLLFAMLKPARYLN